MPPAAVKNPVLLVCGEDEFGVKLRGREVFQQWSGEIGGSDHEVIDAYVNNSGEALAALAKLREALQTLPFFRQRQSGLVAELQFLRRRTRRQRPSRHRKSRQPGAGTEGICLARMSGCW